MTENQAMPEERLYQWPWVGTVQGETLSDALRELAILLMPSPATAALSQAASEIDRLRAENERYQDAPPLQCQCFCSVSLRQSAQNHFHSAIVHEVVVTGLARGDAHVTGDGGPVAPIGGQ